MHLSLNKTLLVLLSESEVITYLLNYNSLLLLNHLISIFSNLELLKALARKLFKILTNCYGNQITKFRKMLYNDIGNDYVYKCYIGSDGEILGY